MDFEMAVRLEPSSTLHAKERAGSVAMLVDAEKLHLTQPRSLLPVELVRPSPHTAMQKWRIVTGGRWLTRPFRDARRFPSTRW